MNVNFAVILIIAFYVISEVVTYTLRNYDKFMQAYALAIRVLVCSLSIITIYCVDNSEELAFADEANEYKYTILLHQDSLIQYQDKMIYDLATHLEDDHGCDIPQFDGWLRDKIDYQKAYIDSLYWAEL